MSSVKQISECFIKPHHLPENPKEKLNMSPWDLVMLSVHYIQKGLLFAKPISLQDSDFMDTLLLRLKNSLSHTLVHFYPLAGRFVTLKSDDPPTYSIHVDCLGGPGVKFIHATSDATVEDVLSPTDVPLIVQSFFDYDGAVNHDAHHLSFISIKVTELVDGVFIGCSMNHAIGDGTSYWNFWNSWSEVFRSQYATTDLTPPISRPPIFDRWFPDGHGPTINLPYKHHDDFIESFECPPLRQRIFHFSTESLARLKARANAEHNTNKISTFQSLSALVWRSVVRVRNLEADQITNCRLAANNRPRLNPPLSEELFGNVIYPIRAFTTVKELLSNDFGWAAWKVHEAVVNHNDKTVRGLLAAWLEAPVVFRLGQLFDPNSVMMGSSPRFDKYGSEFGMGKAIALRSGYGNKVDGKMACYPGREGGGSIDLEVCLSSENMRRIEADSDFMEAAGLSPINAL